MWLPILITAVVSPGCLGLGVWTVGTNRGEAANPNFAMIFRDQRVLSNDHRQHPLPSADLLKEWGEPDSTAEEPDGSSHWRYNGGLRWAGAVLYVVIVPIPLAIPTGREHVVFVVNDGRVVHAYSTANAITTGCFLGYAPYHGGQWVAEWGSDHADDFTNPFE